MKNELTSLNPFVELPILTAELDNTLEEKKRCLRRMGDLKKHNLRVHSEIRDVDARISALQAEDVELDAALAKLGHESTVLIRTFEKLHSDQNSLTAAIATYQDELSRVQDALTREKETISVLNTTTHQMHKQVLQQTKLRDQARSHCDDHSRRLTTLRAQCVDLRAATNTLALGLTIPRADLAPGHADLPGG
ncbi:hypothetical protein PAPYR_10467 [Paratrimastix pyriformis]|uniref:Uncharacterized protein n=1 Tax=Paratrimastix pyriformis TaxID=342808 RepID=A0ABQ8UA31_9EUKA|nr:hypothetical protein PAPYR_10467 [Paratrimastix pyriformis]